MHQSTVLLYDLESIGLIICTRSGVTYRNQVGGQLCVQAEQEGAFVPLEVSHDELERLLGFDFPQGAKGLDSGAVAFVNDLLKTNAGLSFLEIDTGMIQESYEAWVYVRIARVPDSFTPGEAATYGGSVCGMSGMNGVLTWPNSD